MADKRDEGFFERAITNLTRAWRDVSQTAARSLGLADAAPGRDNKQLRTLMRECLEARGGEVSARLRAAELGRSYLQLSEEERREFFKILARDFAVDREQVSAAAKRYLEAGEGERHSAEAELRRTLVPPRVKLLTQLNVLPEGVKFLVDMRADLLPLVGNDADLRALDSDLRDLLVSWFDLGFLDLRRITWDSSASLLEKLIAYEAVHEIRSWTDLRNRLDSDRRLFALFHPRMADEPLAFVEVALVQNMTRSIQALLDETAPRMDPAKVDTAIFYSISNTQRGLRGISFGDYLIKRVVEQLSRDLPALKVFATLSPVPGLRAWLEHLSDQRFAEIVEEEERETIERLGEQENPREALLNVISQVGWHLHEPSTERLRAPLERLCLAYLLDTHDSGQPVDAVARFHLRNGARIERINWMGDTSHKGLRQSAGMMVNYRYVPGEIEKNHEAFMTSGHIALGSDIKAFARSLKLAPISSAKSV